MRVLMLFLDGVGIGKKEPDVNPFFLARLPALRSMLEGELPSLRSRTIASAHADVVPVDANLGIPGLPQSGTGQTALFTGKNAAHIVGRHFGPHPYSTLRPILEEHNIFQRLLNAGKHPRFANAYPQRFFDYIEEKRSRLTATTMSCLMSGIPILRAEDLERGTGISADITGEGWRTLGYPRMPLLEPAEAGRRLARLTEQYDFVLFEYWKTDQAGHTRDMQGAVAVLERLDAMLVGILEALDTKHVLLLVTSDHGNIEDLSVKTHTRNPVPVLLYGHRHAEVAARLRHGARAGDLTMITPLLMDLMTNGS